MEFLGAMFKGIGDTFTAGSQAHQAVIGERNQRRQLDFEREMLSAQGQMGALSFVMGSKQQQTQMVVVIIVAVLALLGIMLIFRKKKA